MGRILIWFIRVVYDEFMKNKSLLIIKIIILIMSLAILAFLLIYLIYFYTRLSDKLITFGDRVSTLENTLDKNVEYRNRGIVNYLELKNLDLDFSYILQPNFYKYVGDPSIWESPEEVYSEVEKVDIFCLTRGIIRPDYHVIFDFYALSKIGLTSTYPKTYPKVEIDYSYFLSRLMEQIYKTHQNVNINNYYFTGCWKKNDEDDIRLSYPDFGFLQHPQALSGDDPILPSQTIVFSGYYDFLIIPNSYSTPSPEPLFLTSSDEFYISYNIGGGGWNDVEVVVIDLNNKTYKNNDVCANIVPVSSQNVSYETGCFVGIEGNPGNKVSDYGFTERK